MHQARSAGSGVVESREAAEVPRLEGPVKEFLAPSRALACSSAADFFSDKLLPHKLSLRTQKRLWDIAL